MEKLLITGVDSLAGSNLALALCERFEVLGLYGQHELKAPGLQTRYCDLQHPAQLQAAVGSFCPKWTIHCGPLAASSWDLQSFHRVPGNQAAIALALAEKTAEVGGQLTVLSTDAVFAGPWMFHDESSSATADSVGAITARAMEAALQATDALVVRTHVYGWSPTDSQPSFAEKVWQSLHLGPAADIDGRRHATPILATDLAALLERAYQLKLQGLYHMTGAERTSPHRFAAELAMALGVPRSRETGARPWMGCYEEETSLNSRRARRAMDLPMPMLREGLARFVEQAANGWRNQCSVRYHAELRQPAA